MRGSGVYIKIIMSFCVSVPPQVPKIDSYNNGSIVEVPHEQQNLSMSCKSKNGKPAPTITWSKNSEVLTDGIEYHVEDAGKKLQNAISVLTIQPQGDDNGVFFTCEAINGALKSPLETTVMLSVMRQYTFWVYLFKISGQREI